MKILVCDDEIITLRTIETKLKREGYEVVTAMDGKVAEEILNMGDIDMLITDLLMPYTTGLELIHYVRNELKLSIPIISVTSIVLEDTVLKSFRMGADDYIIKPFSLNELAFRVKLIFRRRENKMKAESEVKEKAAEMKKNTEKKTLKKASTQKKETKSSNSKAINAKKTKTIKAKKTSEKK